MKAAERLRDIATRAAEEASREKLARIAEQVEYAIAQCEEAAQRGEFALDYEDAMLPESIDQLRDEGFKVDDISDGHLQIRWSL